MVESVSVVMRVQNCSAVLHVEWLNLLAFQWLTTDRFRLRLVVLVVVGLRLLLYIMKMICTIQAVYYQTDPSTATFSPK